MTHFLERNQVSVLNTERNVFALNGRGFIIENNLLVKIMPRLNNGIEIVALFSKVISSETKNQILVCAETGKILGVSKHCYVKYGIHPWICYGNKENHSVLNITQIFPKIQSIADIKEGKVNLGEQELDSTCIVENKVIQKNALGYIGLPLRGYEAFKKYDIYLEIEDYTEYKNNGPKILTLAYHERKAAGIKSLVDIPLEDQIQLHLDLDSFELHECSKLKNSHSNNTAHNEEVELNEEQIEEMNQKAEKERKLKESRQLLNVKSTNWRIFMLYGTTFLFFNISIFFLFWQYFLSEGNAKTMGFAINTAVNFKKGESESFDLVYYSVKLRNSYA